MMSTGRTAGMARVRRGLTVLELLLAVAITAIVGMAIATVMTTVSRGMTSAGEARSALQRVHAAHVRLRAYTDSARSVLAYDPDRGFALWLHDDRPGGAVNLSELRVFWFDAGAQRIRVERVKWPEEWPAELVEAADIELSPSADFFAEMEQQRALGYTEVGTIADGVTDAEMAFNESPVNRANRARMTLRVAVADNESQDVLLAFGFPNHAEPQ